MKLKKNFHPHLFGFAGFSGSGKTTLIEKIITSLSSSQIGYIKHDAHKFEMDHIGKDTYRQFKAGAQMVFINDPTHMALQIKGNSFSLEKEYFQDCDFVIVEGHKYSEHPKFLFLDLEGSAQQEFKSGKIINVMATIYSGNEEKIAGLPSFHRDDINGIIGFIQQKLKTSLDEIRLSALILAGGKSTRMGKDKALISYHGKPQANYMFDLLKDLGLPTYLSCREDQTLRPELSHLPTIVDRFIGFGPLGGIASAMYEHPDSAFLVVACDLPLISQDLIRELIGKRDPLKQATAYFNGARNHFEPLFAIYEPKIYSRLLHFLGERMSCPQKVLFNSSVKVLKLENEYLLDNANTPEDHLRILDNFAGERA
ncbi:MAG: molybdopterin-guanine dinucleotide biosynthesis protein B [Bacteriovoracaceae bacterium]